MVEEKREASALDDHEPCVFRARACAGALLIPFCFLSLMRIAATNVWLLVKTEVAAGSVQA
jgi:hypothetical protein